MLLHATDGFRLATCSNIVIIEFERNLELSEIKRLLHVIKAHHEVVGHQLGLLYLARIGQAPPPEAEAKALYQDLMADRDERLAACAVVCDQSGFVAAMVRSIITGLILFARPRFPTKVFSDLREATSWLSTEMDKHGVGFGDGDALAQSTHQVMTQDAVDQRTAM